MENSNKENDNNIVYSSETIEFVTVANEFCKLLENLNNFSLSKFIENTYKISSLLHLKVLNLQKPENAAKIPSETFITEADWHFIDNAISQKLGQFEVYTEIREPANPDTPAEISMSECLTDIYQDLKDFTTLYRIANEDAILNAVFECKNNFEQFWGPRLLAVSKEFHNLLYGNEELKSENSETNNALTKGKNWVDNIFTDE